MGFTRKAEGGMWQEGESRREGVTQRFADLQITHGKKQIGLICEHARTCARGKGTPGAVLLPQTEPVYTVTPHS